MDRQLRGVTDGDDGVAIPIYGPPKTPTSDREIPLPQVVADTPTIHLERYPAGESGLIFTTARGEPLRKSSIWSVWKKATAAAGVEGGFHQLRHHYASLLIRHGESVVTVQERLGHKSAEETLGTYSHPWPDSDARTRDAVDELFQRGSSEDSPRTQGL